jgi:hypothetical protein
VSGTQAEDGIRDRTPWLLGDGSGQWGPVREIATIEQIIDGRRPELWRRRAL